MLSWPISSLLYEFSGLREGLLSIKQVVTRVIRPNVSTSFLITFQRCEILSFSVFSFQMAVLILALIPPFYGVVLTAFISKAYVHIFIRIAKL